MRDIINDKAEKNIGSLCSFLRNKNNIEYYNLLESSIPNIEISLSEKVYYFYNEISDPLVCDCGELLSFIGFKSGHRSTCGDKKCITKKRKSTCMYKYGVDNPKKSKEILKKERDGINEKWGGHYMLDSSVRSKFNSTMVDRYGVEWAQQSDEISNKSIETFNKNENREYIIDKRRSSLVNKTIKEKDIIEKKKRKSIVDKWGSYDKFIEYRLGKIRDGSIIKYGVDHHFKSELVIDKRVKTYKNNIIKSLISRLPDTIKYISSGYNKNETDSTFNLECNLCLSKFIVNRQFLNFRLLSKVEVCTSCNPILSGKSKRELEVLEFIKEHNIDYSSNDRSVISKELDIFLPDFNIAIEFNGLYWHSDIYKNKNYHLDKTIECEEKGIQLIHIWEDDWDYKMDIVKSIILNKLGKSERIFARKCYIRELDDNKIIRDFLNDNHIQGFVGSSVKLGLYYNDELVSIMTFGKLRRSLGQNSSGNKFELLRFCNKLNMSVVGGASRLFKYFIRNYEFEEIVSYSDNSRGIGNMYNKLGFKLSNNGTPNYHWIIDGVRKHRFNYRKDVLVSEGFDKDMTEVEIMKSRGFNRIFDCGSKKWIYK